MIFDTIVYHHPCSDGMCSAWALWQANKTAKLIPCSHGKKLELSDYENKVVGIVDFSFPRDYLLQIAEKSKKTVLLDHHKSAQRELENLQHPNLEIIFDMNRCGAQIAYDYMFPESKERHWFVEMVADRDLWKWQLPWSKAVGRATYDAGYHSSVEKIDSLINSGVDHVVFITYGEILLEKEEKDIQSCMDRVVLCQFKSSAGTFKVAVATAPYSIRSEVGSRIANKMDVDFVLMYQYVFPQDEYWLSFRAKENNNIDLSVIAKSLPNGGGHPKASGATIYGPNSNPPKEWVDRKGETMFSYLSVN